MTFSKNNQKLHSMLKITGKPYVRTGTKIALFEMMNIRTRKSKIYFSVLILNPTNHYH